MCVESSVYEQRVPPFSFFSLSFSFVVGAIHEGARARVSPLCVCSGVNDSAAVGWMNHHTQVNMYRERRKEGRKSGTRTYVMTNEEDTCKKGSKITCVRVDIRLLRELLRGYRNLFWDCLHEIETIGSG